MAIRFKLGDYQTVKDDPLGRTYVGYFPRMTEDEAWEAGRGVWKMNRDRAGGERFALVVGQGVVRAIAEVQGVSTHEGTDRLSLRGALLVTGHPIYDRYINQPDPLTNTSQNSVTYGELPGEEEFRTRPCYCGCGMTTERDFAPGHDLKAIMARVHQSFDSSVRDFVDWIDDQLSRDDRAPAA